MALISDVQPFFSRVGSLSVELSLPQYRMTGIQFGHIGYHSCSRVPTLPEDHRAAAVLSITGTRGTAAITKLSDQLSGSLHVTNHVVEQSLGVEGSRTLSPFDVSPPRISPPDL